MEKLFQLVVDGYEDGNDCSIYYSLVLGSFDSREKAEKFEKEFSIGKYDRLYYKGKRIWVDNFQLANEYDSLYVKEIYVREIKLNCLDILGEEEDLLYDR